MAEECTMAQVLIEAWRDFSISAEQFRRIRDDFALEIEAGLNGRSSSLQMLPGYVGRPLGTEKGTYLSLDFGGTNVRVAEVELGGMGQARIVKIHKVSLKSVSDGYDYTSAEVQLTELFDFIAKQVAKVADGKERLLGHSFSYAGRQTAIGRAEFVGWTKEIKVSGLAGQDINAVLSAALERQQLGSVRPVAVLNDTTATLLTAAYSSPLADMGSVCGTGYNICYYEQNPRHGTPGQVMAYNAEAGGFDRLPFSLFDEELNSASEYPGRQRLEKMVSGRYLGELTRRILWAGRGQCGMRFVEGYELFQQPDGLSSLDVSVFVGDESRELASISDWLSRRCSDSRVELAERHFIKAVAELVVSRSSTLAAASYAGFLHWIDPGRRQRHLIGINGSLYEKMPGFADKIHQVLAEQGKWSADQLTFLPVDEAPILGAAIAAAVAEREGERS